MYYYIMYLCGRLRRQFIHQIPENKSHYKISRNAFIVDGATANTIIALVSGVYLSGFLEYIGVSPTLNGIISALPALVSISQPLGAIYAQNHPKRKPFVCAGALIHRLIFTSLFFVPCFIGNKAVTVAAVTLLLCIAHFIAAFISPAASNWIISLTPQKIRGKYFSTREMYTLATLSAVSLIAGFFLDRTKASENQGLGFIIVGVIVGILAIVNFISLSRVMEPESIEQPAKGISLANAIKMVATDKEFRPVLLAYTAYNLAIQIAVPYHGIYLIGDLQISYNTISIITFICSIEKIVIMRRWGRLADKTSWANACKISIGIIGIAHIANSLLMPQNAWWLYPVTAIASNIGWAAIGISILNVQYDYAPLKGRTLYIGVAAAISGLIGFFGVFIGSFIMKMTIKTQPYLFGIELKGQQILMLLSGLLLLGCSVYISNVLEKKQKIINNKEGSVL